MNRVDLLEKTINDMYILKQELIGELERIRDDYMVLEERVRNKTKEVKDGER